MFPGTCLQPNTYPLKLTRQAKTIEFLGNSQAPLFTRQVVQVSNKTGLDVQKIGHSASFAQPTDEQIIFRIVNDSDTKTRACQFTYVCCPIKCTLHVKRSSLPVHHGQGTHRLTPSPFKQHAVATCSTHYWLLYLSDRF